MMDIGTQSAVGEEPPQAWTTDKAEMRLQVTADRVAPQPSSAASIEPGPGARSCPARQRIGTIVSRSSGGGAPPAYFSNARPGPYATGRFLRPTLQHQWTATHGRISSTESAR